MALRKFLKFWWICLSMIMFFLQSCSSGKQIIYFQNVDSMSGGTIGYGLNTIRPNDILSVRINALVPETAQAYNLQLNQNGGGQGNNLNTNGNAALSGYIVSLNGYINLPILGKIKVLGKTPASVEEELTQLLENEGHLVKPSVHVRVMNSKITVLGEVSRPGTFILNDPFITLPQALGYAGDLTINGKRNNIRIIRDKDGVRETLTVDLTKPDWLNNERYRVRQNDIIIVNPNSKMIKSAGHLGNIGSFFGAFSFVLSTILLLTR